MAPCTPISVLIMEDHPVFLRRLVNIVDRWHGNNTVISCSSVGDAISAIDTYAIDLLLADLKLPDGSGVDAVRYLRQTQPQAQALVISALANREVILDALVAGAAGYIHKEDSSTNIEQSMQQVLDGGSPLSPSIAREILDFLSKTRTSEQGIASNKGLPVAVSTPPNRPLTDRESEVLQAISKGYSNRDVADLLGIAASTVPVHVRNIYRKLEVSNRTQAVFEARKLGLLSG